MSLDKPKSIVELAKLRKESEASAKDSATVVASVVKLEASASTPATIAPTAPPLEVSASEKAAVLSPSFGQTYGVDGTDEQDGFRSTASLPAPISGVDRSKVPEHSYIALNLNQCILPDGRVIKPTNGYYYPGDYAPAVAEALYKELEHFAEQYGLVERVLPAKDSKKD